jgi:hypothetical protein
LHNRLEWKETNLRLPWIRESYASAMHVGLEAALPAGDVRMRRNMWGELVYVIGMWWQAVRCSREI